MKIHPRQPRESSALNPPDTPAIGTVSVRGEKERDGFPIGSFDGR